MPLNFGISEGSLVGMGGQKELCLTRSFIGFNKSGKFKVVRKGSLGLTGELKVPGGSEVVRVLWKASTELYRRLVSWKSTTNGKW